MTATIITPAYNVSKYIVQTVESILAEKKTINFEYIVLDDGSTDDTLSKLKCYQKDLHLISHKNMGEPATVNEGVKLAKNDIVAVVNADDPIYPGLVQNALDYLSRDENLVAVYPDWNKIDAEGNIIEKIHTLEYDYDLILERYLCIPGPGTFFRKSALKGEYVRNTHLKFSSDFDLWVRLGLKGPMKRIPKLLATWRYHEQGGSQKQRGQEMANNRVQVMETFFQRHDLPPLIQKKKRQALSAAYYNAALLAIHNQGVSGKSFLLKSFFYQWFWRKTFYCNNGRNWRYIVYILGSPVTRWIYPIGRKLGLIRRKLNG